jgi:glutathione peroxidase
MRGALLAMFLVFPVGCAEAGSVPVSLAAPTGPVLDQAVVTIDGKEAKLSDYRGKAVLIVNTASRCGYTPQYEGLEALYKEYQPKGLVVLGFPSNDFMGQEPGTEAEIVEFCKSKYDVSFPMFSKVHTTGADIHPLFKALTTEGPAELHGDVAWNFNKFLVDPDGHLRARWGSKVTPEDPGLRKMIDQVLPKS